MAEALNLPPFGNEPSDPRRERLATRLTDDILKGIDSARAVLSTKNLTAEAIDKLKRETKFLAPPFVEFDPKAEDTYQAASRCRSALKSVLTGKELRRNGLIARPNERTSETYPEYPLWSLMKDLVTITPVIDKRTFLQGEPYQMAVVQHLKCFVDGTPMNWRALLWFSLDHAVHAFDVRSKIRP